MASNNPQVGDIGTILRITIQDSGTIVDISGATTKQILLLRPDGSELTNTAIFSTNGLDGDIQYSTIANDLNTQGQYRIQGYVELSGGSWHTSVSYFSVSPNV